MARGRVGVASSLTVTGELPWSHQHSNRVASGHWRVLGISLAGAWRLAGGCLTCRWRVTQDLVPKSWNKSPLYLFPFLVRYLQ